MAGFNPSIERQVIWGYTEDEIADRWKLWQEWDVLHRMFGKSGEGNKFNTKSNIPSPNVKGRALDILLDSL